MPVLRLTLEIDGEVYPELYVALAGLQRPAARDERLRQLAAVGLAWEAVRLHGLPAARLPADALAPVRKPAPPGAVPLPAPAPAVRSGRVAGKAPRAAPAPARARDPDFVDLGISAVPAEPELPAPGLEEPPRHVAAGGLPVLLDVVDTGAPQPSVDGIRVPAVAPEPDADADADADAAVSFDDESPAVHLLPTIDHVEGHGVLGAAVHRSPRSRLIRMKERGLFKNG